MPTLEINGRDVEVDDSFLSLSPEQQNATVDEIVQSMGNQTPTDANTTTEAPVASGGVYVGQYKPTENFFGKGGSYDAGARGVLAGITGNYDDEIAAGIATGFGYLGDYSKTQKDLDEYKKQVFEAHPTASIVGQLGGGITGAAGLAKGGLTLMGKATTLPGKIAAGVAEGLGYGAVYGSGDAKQGERGAGALSGAGTGAAIGGAIPIVGKGLEMTVGPIARRFMGSSAGQSVRKAAKGGLGKIQSTLDDAGISFDDALEGVKRGRVLAQQDDTLADLTRSVQREVSPARKIINDGLESGFEANQATATKSIKDGLGGADNFYSWLDDFKKAKVKNAKPLYDAGFAKDWGSSGPPMALDDLLPSIPAQAMKEAQTIAKAKGKPLFGQLIASIDEQTDTVIFKRVPTLEEAEYIRRGLDDMASKAFRGGSGGSGTAVSDLSNELRSIIDDASPIIKSTRATYADEYAIEKAAESAKTWLNKDADFIEFAVNKMSKPEKEAAARGFAAAVKGRLERGDINRDQVRIIFGSKQKQNALKTLWKDKTAFDGFADEMAKAAEFNSMRGVVRGNSRTQMDLNAQASLDDIGNVGMDIMTGNKIGLIRSAMKVMSKKFSKANPEQLEYMAKILMERDPQNFEMLFKSAAAGNKAAQATIEKAIQKMLPMQPIIGGAVAVSNQ